MNYDYSFAAADLNVIKRIKSCVANQETIILTDLDVVALNRLLSSSHLYEEGKNN